jgi:glutamyl-tRNA reductase
LELSLDNKEHKNLINNKLIKIDKLIQREKEREKEKKKEEEKKEKILNENKKENDKKYEEKKVNDNIEQYEEKAEIIFQILEKKYKNYSLEKKKNIYKKLVFLLETFKNKTKKEKVKNIINILIKKLKK